MSAVTVRVLGTLKRRVLRDVFIVNTSNKEAQAELCRSTKTPDEVYRIALSNERVDQCAKSYRMARQRSRHSAGGAIAIKNGTGKRNPRGEIAGHTNGAEGDRTQAQDWSEDASIAVKVDSKLTTSGYAQREMQRVYFEKNGTLRTYQSRT